LYILVHILSRMVAEIFACQTFSHAHLGLPSPTSENAVITILALWGKLGKIVFFWLAHIAAPYRHVFELLTVIYRSSGLFAVVLEHLH